MGRLRGDRDAALFCRIAAEVTDLFVTVDCTLYRYFGAEDENLARKDPLWDEPTTVAAFEAYELPCFWFDWNSNNDQTEHGRDEEIDARAYLTTVHLEAAGVIVDPDGERVTVGDVISIHDKCGHGRYDYDILQTNREGWVNNSDKFVGYVLNLKRRDKYVPERKTRSIPGIL